MAGASYYLGQKLYSEYDHEWKYPHSAPKRVRYTEVMMPSNAPPEYADRQSLWNAVDAAEKSRSAQTARHDLQSLYDEYRSIRWKGAKERFAADHADELEQCKKTQRLLHKFGLSHPLDRKLLRAAKVQLEQKMEELRPDINAVQYEMDELTDLLERTAKQVVSPQQKEEQRTSMQQSKETL